MGEIQREHILGRRSCAAIEEMVGVRRIRKACDEGGSWRIMIVTRECMTQYSRS
jgi:hypothetical protein